MAPNSIAEREILEIDGNRQPVRRKLKVFEVTKPNENKILQEEEEEETYLRRAPKKRSVNLQRSASSDQLQSYINTNDPNVRRKHVSVASYSRECPTPTRSSQMPKNGFECPQPPKKARKISQVSNKNGNMFIQLVIPQQTRQQNFYEQSNQFSLNSSNNSDLGLQFKNPLRKVSSNNDLYSISGNLNNENYVTPQEQYEDEVFINNISCFSTRHNSLEKEETSKKQSKDCACKEEKELESTPEDERKEAGREFLTKILSCIYALFIVSAGLVIYVSDVVIGKVLMAEIYSYVLILLAFSFLVYLIADIRVYMNNRYEYLEALRKIHRQDDISLLECPEGDIHLSIPIKDAAKLQKPLHHHYCLIKGRHSGSFYLKIGAAGFCLGHLIHSSLCVSYQLVFLTSNSELFYVCSHVATLILDIIYPIYSFFLLYFIFKYSNVIINRHKTIARFGLMHCLSSSICFWVWTIIRETVDSLTLKGIEVGDNLDNSDEQDNGSVEDVEDNFLISLVKNKPFQVLTRSSTDKNYNMSLRFFTTTCRDDKGWSIIYRDYSPYLYPFTVEYSILTVGVLFVIWQYIGSCQSTCEGNNTELQAKKDPPKESNVVIHADFHSANKGLFAGIVVIVLSGVAIILYFISASDEKFYNIGAVVNSTSHIVLFLLMLVSGFFAYRKITLLDINKHPISLLDDILIFICIPAFFFMGIFSMVSSIEYGSEYGIVYIALEILQMLIQTPLIIDGLRRCSNTKELRRKKPARELVTFLIVCNVALWLMETFEMKSSAVEDFRYKFYGKLLWTIIGHVTLPLIMFYRFHSSVCLVDIWKYAYEPASY